MEIEVLALKLHEKYFNEVLKGSKNFTIRKLNPFHRFVHSIKVKNIRFIETGNNKNTTSRTCLVKCLDIICINKTNNSKSEFSEKMIFSCKEIKKEDLVEAEKFYKTEDEPKPFAIGYSIILFDKPSIS